LKLSYHNFSLKYKNWPIAARKHPVAIFTFLKLSPVLSV
jgi:hypothetical protein